MARLDVQLLAETGALMCQRCGDNCLAKHRGACCVLHSRTSHSRRGWRTHTNCRGRHLQVDVRGEGRGAGVHSQHRRAGGDIRRRHVQQAVEAAGTQQRGVHAVGAVCGPQHHHAPSRLRMVLTW